MSPMVAFWLLLRTPRHVGFVVAIWCRRTHYGGAAKRRSDMSAQTTQSDRIRAVTTRRVWSTFRAAHNLALPGEQLVRLGFDRNQGDRRVGQQFLA
jgi:hypothetical protein